MEKFNLNKPNGQQVSCLQEIPQDPKGIVIAIHGFTSSKECMTVEMLRRRMPAAGIGVVAIDQPSHGVEASAREELRISNCIDSLEVTEGYVQETFPGLPIYYFASSFGAYITGLYISSRPHLGRRVFFRSAAVNMPSLFIKDEMTETDRRLMRDLETQGYFNPVLDLYGETMVSTVKVTKAMMQDLAENDLFEKFDPDRFGPHLIAMAHGEADTVIDPQEALRFARKFSIPITVFEAEAHSLSLKPETPDKVADLAIALYRCEEGKS
ncbi:MAG: alpha/beta hydrolase [Eubacteriales bacterium]|nr:alpha/beta hydrolase [Eubacteriales bacterium]